MLRNTPSLFAFVVAVQLRKLLLQRILNTLLERLLPVLAMVATMYPWSWRLMLGLELSEKKANKLLLLLISQCFSSAIWKPFYYGTADYPINAAHPWVSSSSIAAWLSRLSRQFSPVSSSLLTFQFTTATWFWVTLPSTRCSPFFQ
jgi:hypothetical protein